MIIDDKVPIERLLLDPNNYRIKNHIHYEVVDPSDYAKEDVQRRTLTIVCGEKDENIQDLLTSFRENGFLPIDQIQVRKYGESGMFLVVEGNRRVSALKRLYNDYRKFGRSLGKLNPEIFTGVSVVVFDVENESDAMILMGLKHISGNLKWSEYNQALFIYDLFEKYHLDKDAIAEKVAVSKVAVGLSLRALALVRQYKESDYGDQFVESKFALFKEVVRNKALKDWIGWDETTLQGTALDKLDMLFSLISQDIADEDESDRNGASTVEPAIVKRNELRQLSEMLPDSAAMDYLIKTRNLMAAYSRSVAVARDQAQSRLESLSLDINSFRSFRIDANGLARLVEAREQLSEIIATQQETDRKTENLGANILDCSDGRVLSRLDIVSYKAFAGFTLDGLSQFNVIAGVNNSGKSTLLEAVALLVRQSDVGAALRLIDKRGKRMSERDGYEWTVAQLTEFEICGVCGGREASVRLSKGKDSDVVDQEYLVTVEMEAACGDLSQSSMNKVYRGKFAREPLSSKSVCSALFNTPFYSNEQANYRKYYYDCTENKAIDKIIDFIRRNILATVERIYWDSDRRRFMVSDEKFPLAVDLSFYGEGLQRVFLLALLFASAENGIVLADELENAIHPSLIGDFVSLIVKLAHEFNVQLFATTHSKECVDGFVAACRAGECPDDYTFIGIVNDVSSRRIARVFPGSKYLDASDIADVDLRRVV